MKHGIWDESEAMFSCIVCVFSNTLFSPFYFMNIAIESVTMTKRVWHIGIGHGKKCGKVTLNVINDGALW